MKSKAHISLILASIVGFPLTSIGLVPSVFAQAVLEEVIVTAQRREESIQDVPVSMTAFTGEELVRQNIGEVKNYFQSVPNVSFTEDGEVGARSVGISIRGVSDQTNTFTGVGGLPRSYAVYVDEFDISNNATKTANPGLVDIERVEVLRGPQGTYFGRNASGGALNLSTKLPNGEFEYEMNMGYSKFDTWDVSGVVNSPITDTFFIRGMINYEQSDGFLTNLSATGSDDGYDYMNGRVAVRWLANDAFTLDLSLTGTDENGGTDSTVNSGVFDIDTGNSSPGHMQDDPFDYVNVATNVFVPAPSLFPIDSGAGFYPDNRRTINKDFHELNENSQTVVNLRTRYEGDGWALRTVTGLLESESHRQFDQDVMQYALYESYNGRQGDTFSQEVRVELNNSDNWNWVFGAIYANEDQDNYGVSPIGAAGFWNFRPGTLRPDGTLPPGFRFPQDCSFCLAPGQMIAGPSLNTFDLESWAGFAELHYVISDEFSVTVGARYTDDKIHVINASGTRAGDFVAQPMGILKNFDMDAYLQSPMRAPTRDGEASFDAITPRLVLAWAPNDTLNTYASISRGYKPGGLTFHAQTFEEIPFEEEYLWNYEVGAKWRSDDNRAALNAAIFYMDWEGMPIPTFDIKFVTDAAGNTGISTTFLVRTTDAVSKGAELDGQFLVGDGLRLGGAVGYLDTEFRGFPATSPFIVNGAGFALDGETVPRSPKWTLSAFAQYDWTFNDKDTWFRVEWSHRSSIESDIEGTVSLLPILDPATLPPEYQNLNNFIRGPGGVPFEWPRDEFPVKVPSYDIVNIRAGIEGSRWAFTAYVENVFDDNYYTGTQENFGFGGFRIRPHFAVWGVNLRWYTGK